MTVRVKLRKISNLRTAAVRKEKSAKIRAKGLISNDRRV